MPANEVDVVAQRQQFERMWRQLGDRAIEALLGLPRVADRETVRCRGTARKGAEWRISPRANQLPQLALRRRPAEIDG
jgi:hypothetical protein